ncbi:hypothetical protein VKT23_012911 [Stygiomarasmius scandens]|uniref:Carbohydrate esterase 2 N-terminal domain-containing protein n=1 Tax=Marasmiellus scandens TaxID=2682957 RepID=A0ABR1J572_9AGAR
MSQSALWIAVDDMGEELEYSESPQWMVYTSNAISEVTGFAVDDSLHSASTDGMSVSFRFNGISELGTSRAVVYDFLGFGNNGNPSVECILDQTHAGDSSVSQSAHTTQLCLFNDTTLSPGEHELTLHFKQSGVQDSILYLDYILYEPLPDVPINDGALLQIGNSLVYSSLSDEQPFEASHFSVSSGWRIDGVQNETLSTQSPGSSITVKFNGTEIDFYGQTNTSSTVTYQLDDQAMLPIPFQSNELPASLHLQRSSLAPGEHTLVVMTESNASKTDMTVNYFLVQAPNTQSQDPQTNPPLSSSTPTTSTSPSSPAVQTSGDHSTGGIVGGLIGGLLLFGIASYLLWARNHRRKKNMIRELEPTPFTEADGPSEYNKSGTIPHKNSKGISTRTSPSVANQNDSEAINVLQTGHLKLQQSLAVLLARPLPQCQNPTQDVVEQESWAGPSMPRVHTDSGWRMRETRVGYDEVPPDYSA